MQAKSIDAIPRAALIRAQPFVNIGRFPPFCSLRPFLENHFVTEL